MNVSDLAPLTDGVDKQQFRNAMSRLGAAVNINPHTPSQLLKAHSSPTRKKKKNIHIL